MNLLDLATFGLPAVDVALAVPRIAVGAFFAISGFHKLTVADRHASLVATLKADRVPAVGLMQWFVPFWELVSGSLVLVGAFTAFNAAVLAVVMLVACVCEAKEKVDAYRPINAADRLDDYLYLPEVLYVLLLAVPLMAGPGAFSLDHLLFR